MGAYMPSVPSDIYDSSYQQEENPVWQRFIAARGKNWTIASSYVLSLCNIQDGMTVLEIGCGKGGFTFTCARERCITAVGMDYAAEAMRVATTVTRQLVDDEFKGRLLYIRADAARLPLAPSSVDVVFSCHVIEHLYPEQLANMFSDCWRLLKPGGRVVVETGPNLWRLRYAFPLTRAVYRRVPFMAHIYKELMGLAKVPWEAKTDDDARYHVNEQSVASLHRALREAGFKAKTWIGPGRKGYFGIRLFWRRWRFAGLIAWLGYALLYRLWPLKLLFGDTVFGVGEKPGDQLPVCEGV